MVSDILFLQKRDCASLEQPEWVQLDTTPEGYRMNAYFVRHPEMVLGELSVESTQYGKQEVTVKPIEGMELAVQLKEAISHIQGEMCIRDRGNVCLIILPVWKVSGGIRPGRGNMQKLLHGQAIAEKNSRCSPMSEEKGQKKRQKKNRRLRKKKNLPVFVRTRKQRSSRWKGSVRKSRER